MTVGPATIGYVTLQLAQMFLEFRAATKDMTDEQAKEHFFTKVQPGVAEAEARWDAAGDRS